MWVKGHRDRPPQRQPPMTEKSTPMCMSAHDAALGLSAHPACCLLIWEVSSLRLAWSSPAVVCRVYKAREGLTFLQASTVPDLCLFPPGGKVSIQGNCYIITRTAHRGGTCILRPGFHLGNQFACSPSLLTEAGPLNQAREPWMAHFTSQIALGISPLKAGIAGGPSPTQHACGRRGFTLLSSCLPSPQPSFVSF